MLFAAQGAFHRPYTDCLPGLYAYPVIAAQKVHLTSKPVELIEELLAVTAPQAKVLDPFMGGGSVGEACIRTGHDYIGIELSPEYFDISPEEARKRPKQNAKISPNGRKQAGRGENSPALHFVILLTNM